VITTRSLESSDRDDWCRLFTGYLHFNQATLPSELAELTFNRLIDCGVDLHAAIAWGEDHEAVGLVQWTTQLSTRSPLRNCHLDSLFVRPGVRGFGAGTALISHVREWAEGEDCAKVAWMTPAENAAARAANDRFSEPSMFAQYAIHL
jgi:GNAT superfamily N-acetyltransferase